jgi:hypothetical protein
MQEEDSVLICRVSVEGAKTLLVDDRRSDEKDDDDDDGRLWQNCRQARLAMDSSLWVMIMMLYYCLYCYWLNGGRREAKHETKRMTTLQPTRGINTLPLCCELPSPALHP